MVESVSKVLESSEIRYTRSLKKSEILNTNNGIEICVR